MSAVSIDELPIPSSADDLARAEGGRVVADFAEIVQLRNAVQSVALGNDALSCSAAELLPHYAQEFEPKTMLVARIGSRIVGRAVLEWSVAVGTTSSWVNVEVLPEFRSRGIGSALLLEVEDRALASGRPTLQAEAMHTSRSGGVRVVSPNGFGDLPADDPGVRFLTSHGYRLEQIERCSFLDLPADPSVLNPIFARAAAVAGPTYRLVSWVGPTLDERIDDLILLRTRMSTDAPMAGLDVDEEPWTKERIVKHDETVAGGGRTVVMVAVEHVPTGRLVGFSDLSYSADRTRPAMQQDTLVLSEHRGRHLGTLLKIANIRTLDALDNPPRLIFTFNAEENRHMLDVNEAVGFYPAGKAGAWRKHD